jgi:hypothetical protein
MKRIEMASDYSEFLLRAKFLIRNIDKEANDRNYDVAEFMAVELRSTALLLEQALQKLKPKG